MNIQVKRKDNLPQNNPQYRLKGRCLSIFITVDNIDKIEKQKSISKIYFKEGKPFSVQHHTLKRLIVDYPELQEKICDTSS